MEKPELSIMEQPTQPSVVTAGSGIRTVSRWVGELERRAKEVQEHRAQKAVPQVYKSPWERYRAKPRWNKYDQRSVEAYDDRKWLEENLRSAHERRLIRFDGEHIELIPLTVEQLPDDLVHVSDFYKVLGLPYATEEPDKRFPMDVVELFFNTDKRELTLLNLATEEERVITSTFGAGDLTRPLYIAGEHFVDSVVLDIRDYPDTPDQTLTLDQASRSFRFVMMFLDKEKLLSERAIYLDPESLSQKRFFDEFGGTFFTTGGLPLKCVKDIIQGHQSNFYTKDNIIKHPPRNGRTW